MSRVGCYSPSVDARSALYHIKQDRNAADFWERSKQDAIIEARKTQIFVDDINGELEILDKYRK